MKKIIFTVLIINHKTTNILKKKTMYKKETKK